MRIFNVILGASAVLAAGLPALPVFAQGGELSRCRPLGQEVNYPCVLPFARGVVRSERAHFQRLRYEKKKAGDLNLGRNRDRFDDTLGGQINKGKLLERLLNR